MPELSSTLLVKRSSNFLLIVVNAHPVGSSLQSHNLVIWEVRKKYFGQAASLCPSVHAMSRGVKESVKCFFVFFFDMLI